jgi:hypothetical protein
VSDSLADLLDALRQDPLKIVDELAEHYQGQMDDQRLSTGDVDLAADICLVAADLAFQGVSPAGNAAAAALDGNYEDGDSTTAFEVAADAFYVAMVRMGVTAAQPEEVGPDERGHLFLEASQILREVLAGLRLPASTAN